MQVYNNKVQVGKMEIGINDEQDYGYFEHEDYGDEFGGGLWFEAGELVDFDGVGVLPLEVARGIKQLGLICDEDQFCY